MITDALKYGAVYTKVRAKTGKMLKSSDYDTLIQFKTVKDAVGYLKANTGYAQILKDINEDNAHRSQIERILRRSIFVDYSNLHQFVFNTDRRFISIFFIRYEIDILKYLLRTAMAGSGDKAALETLPEEFLAHSTLNVLKLMRAQSVEDIIGALEHTPYGDLIQSLYKRDKDPNSFDIETALDLYYFSILWRNIGHNLSNQTRAAAKNSIGSEADMLNLLWVYRSKKYYHIPPELIYGFIIPIHYKINRQMLTDIIQSENPEDVIELAATTNYGNIFKTTDAGYSLFVRKVTQLTAKVYKKSIGTNPYTVLSILNYFMHMDLELRNIISIIEGIRYGLPPEQIKEFVVLV